MLYRNRRGKRGRSAPAGQIERQRSGPICQQVEREIYRPAARPECTVTARCIGLRRVHEGVGP